MIKIKDSDELKKQKELFNIFFKLLEDDRLPYELYEEYMVKIQEVVRGKKNS